VPESRPEKRGPNVPAHPDQGLYEFLLTHRDVMITALVIAVVVMIGLAGLRYLHGKREGAAASELMVAWGEVDPTERVKKLDAVLADYSGAPARRFVLLAKAQAQCEARDYEGALVTARSKAVAGSTQSVVVSRAKLLEAAAAEGLGRVDEARKTYVEMAASGDAFFARVAELRLDALEEMTADASRADRDPEESLSDESEPPVETPPAPPANVEVSIEAVPRTEQEGVAEQNDSIADVADEEHDEGAAADTNAASVDTE